MILTKFPRGFWSKNSRFLILLSVCADVSLSLQFKIKNGEVVDVFMCSCVLLCLIYEPKINRFFFRLSRHKNIIFSLSITKWLFWLWFHEILRWFHHNKKVIRGTWKLCQSSFSSSFQSLYSLCFKLSFWMKTFRGF